MHGLLIPVSHVNYPVDDADIKGCAFTIDSRMRYVLWGSGVLGCQT